MEAITPMIVKVGDCQGISPKFIKIVSGYSHIAAID